MAGHRSGCNDPIGYLRSWNVEASRPATACGWEVSRTNLMSSNAEVSGASDASMCTTEGRSSIWASSTTALFDLGVFLIGTFLAEANKFTAPNWYLREPLPSQFTGELVQRKFRTVLPAAWSASHPNDGEA